MTAPTRTLLNRTLNLALLLAGAFMMGSGWIMAERLPQGRAYHDLTILGLSRHGWGGIHTWVGYAMGAMVLAHLALHTAWLKRIAAMRRPWLLGLGLGSAAAIILILAVILPVRG
ncbi:DUF4405 domain-containing protein [Actomonas aquatica]|uniref:DUF4405 domain-containing protein n=1 Tax=Actomonas aquatica TaxID=2866162 RepID=A0ABZ1C439_9BACT|nr:DUF4405 domain-containing protein [Opitutus sp. WL0086]WRQ86488.1 DUF4405 domain-containing protein [Opitutus sp. WL0086]